MAEIDVPRRELTRAQILMEFFGKKQGQTSMEFLREVQALNEDERAMLANLAAIEMGVLLKVA